MEIDLRHPSTIKSGFDLSLDGQEGVTIVGLVNIDDTDEDLYYPLAIVQCGRVRKLAAIINGEAADIEAPDAGAEFHSVFEDLISDIWPEDHVAALTRLFGFNRRSVQRDRISTWLIPGPVVQLLTYVHSRPDRRAFAQMLLVMCEYADLYDDPKKAKAAVLSAVDFFYDDKNQKILRPQSGDPK
ncbi:hypothetical protein [Devosia sp. Leaf64]|uniref:hypothetical protein n=1 Tax=Devosia sp. Leaf64 TaxID=1736229 RepID=UPI0007152F3D|nr:hypothetical protein [Devosia sp. Leaf64]KQN75096.1 hypothetical protein ASE94_01895 [Devosia sp. Leaf64]